MKREKIKLALSIVGVISFVIGLWILWGQWNLLAGLFFLTFANNISMGTKDI